tara:strand:- start:5148 stop:6317 length:1170 start_codon:yes stop_codon:yes gene_type:complete
MPVFVGAAGSSFLHSNQIGVGRTSTAGRNAGVNTETGAFIYNTDLNGLQYWNGSSWIKVSSPFTATGGNQANVLEPGNGYAYHTFSSNGSLVVSSGEVDADIVVVAGGGGGGANNNGGSDGGGGGGAGGVAKVAAYPLTPGTYNINVGSGGAGGLAPGTQNSTPPCATKSAPYSGQAGSNGGDSIFGASSPAAKKITASGGGGGGSGPNAGNHDCGGSGGGAGSGGNPGSPGGASNQAPHNSSYNETPITNYGNAGGTSPATPPFTGAGGGGSSTQGSDGSENNPGVGGGAIDFGPAGFEAPLIGIPALNPHSGYFASGGSGGRQNNSDSDPVAGGNGGGGRGASANADAGTGAANGSGGGGGSGSPAPDVRYDGANGGTGLVIIRYSV